MTNNLISEPKKPENSADPTFKTRVGANYCCFGADMSLTVFRNYHHINIL